MKEIGRKLKTNITFTYFLHGLNGICARQGNIKNTSYDIWKTAVFLNR